MTTFAVEFLGCKVSLTDAQEVRERLAAGGHAEADPERLTVLAQTAVAVDDLDAVRLSAELRTAEAELAEAKDDQSKRMAEMLVDVLKRLQAKAA